MAEQHVLARFNGDPKLRSMSISNGILAHQRAQVEAARTSKERGIIVGSPLASNATSNDHSSCEDGSDPGDASEDSEDDALRGIIQYRMRPRERVPRVPGVHVSASGTRLTRFRSHPHAALDAALLLPRDSPRTTCASSLGRFVVFNKRPPTDTPMMSMMPSPETRYQSSGDEDGSPRMFEPLSLLGSVLPTHGKKEANAELPPLHNTKDISHLSLADLNLVAAKMKSLGGKISPRDTLKSSLGASAAAANAGLSEAVNTSSASTSALTAASETTVTPETAAERLATLTLQARNASEPSVHMADREEVSGEKHEDKKNHNKLDMATIEKIRSKFLCEVPEDLQKQFEKTPSFDKLKSMLLMKKPPTQKAYTLNIPGQTSSKVSPDGKIASVDVGSKLVIVMVGLPARGKSYITNKITRYLNWIQHDCRVFNVGNTRRNDKTNVLGPAHRPLPDGNTPLPPSGQSPENQPMSPKTHRAEFFDPENKASTELREKWAMDTLETMLDWVLLGSGSVGILDATNSTKKRRLKVLRRIQERTNGELKVLFLESICLDPAILDTNIRLKLLGPDYCDMDPEVALRDFLGRLCNYERAYQTIDETEEAIEGYQYVKMIDVGKKVVSYNVLGFLASQTIYFLLNLNLCERQIWLTRHGESVDNLSGRIGGDSRLTKRGRQFSRALSRFMAHKRREFRRNQLEKFSQRLELRYNEILGRAPASCVPDSDAVQIPTEPNFCVWTSMLLRAQETGRYFSDCDYNVKAMRMLNELGGGKFEGMTYEEIQRDYPREFQARFRNKLEYRYPGVGGESYLDVLLRLRPLINEMERTTGHLVIVSHRVVSRVLLAYFLNLDRSAITELDVPLHTLYCLELKPYGTDYTMYEYDEATDWFTKIEPEHRKNVKEVGVNFSERKYSVIPTAPPLSSRRPLGVGKVSVRPSLRGQDSETNLLATKRADLEKLRKP